MIDTATLQAAAVDGIGDVLQSLGAKVRGSAAKGRATCPVHQGDGFNTDFGNGFATCHSACGDEVRDALRLVADCRGLDLRRGSDFREAAEELGGILNIRVDEEAPRRSVARPPRSVPPIARTERPSRDAEALWGRLAQRNVIGERYLGGRGLIMGEPLPDLVRFNIGTSLDTWLDARAREGFLIAFPVRRPDGTIQTLSLRHIGPGDPPEAFGKSPTLAGCSTRGAAICRPEIALLASGNPEFDRDEIIVLEGGPDTVAATLAFDLDSIEQRTPPTWALGAVGAPSVSAMLEAFAGVIRGRVVHIALDVDSKGEAAVPAAVEAAWKAGARRVTRIRPPCGKDLAEAWSSHE